MNQPIFSADQLQAAPYDAAFEWLEQTGTDPLEVLWIMPRIETAAGFKQRWARHFQGKTALAPWIQTADRLSQPLAMGPWLSLQADLVGVLRQLPLLAGGTSSGQLWGLAQEYLELAMRQVLVQKRNTSTLAEYSLKNSFAAEEAQVVAHLASTYEEELLALIPRPVAPGGRKAAQVLWFNDGETVPGLWLELFFPEVPVKVFKLPLIEGPQPWRELTALRFTEQPSPICLQVAPDETTQAQQAAHQILDWLRIDPNTEIAVAVLDRLAARRMVRLLADSGVLVDDRTGWRLSTSNIAGWLDQLFRQHAEQGQLSQVTQPFTGLLLENFQPWAFGKMGGRYPLAQWAEAFAGLFEQYQLDIDLQADEAGRQLMTLLGLMKQVPSQTGFDALEFVGAWRNWAEAQRFRPFDIESPVRMVPLLSTRMRRFERVLVLGCAQSHFQESPPGLLPPSVAQELGFSGPRVARVQKISALHELLLNSRQVTLLHCGQVAGKPETLLQELTWVDIVLRNPEAWNEHWSACWHRVMTNTEITIREVGEPLLSIAALRGGASVPPTLRVTALDEWMACRLGFGLKHALPWAGQVDEGGMSYEQLRGIFVHKVLEKTAKDMAKAGQAISQLESWKHSLHTQALAVWNGLTLEEQATVYPFLKFFDQIVPRIAGKLMERHIQGWQFSAAEHPVEHVLNLRGCGTSMLLKGRVDRLDTRGGVTSIADIKFKHPKELKKRLADPLSQPQLPAYQAILNAPDAQLDFLGLHKNGVDWVSFPALSDEWKELGFQSWGEVLFDELTREADRFFSGDVQWQATPGEACTWCKVKGVCRPAFTPDLDEEEAEDE